MILGIVGSEAVKFTPENEVIAKGIIRRLLSPEWITGVSSGHCHLGGIDIWAEEIGKELGKNLFIYPPASQTWESYKERNIRIAYKSDRLHCITVKELPPTYKGMTFEECYHCKTNSHVKSGGCWTVKYGKKLGKAGTIIVI